MSSRNYEHHPISAERSEDDDSSTNTSSGLDNTLLESLFYNEMLMLNDNDVTMGLLSTLGAATDASLLLPDSSAPPGGTSTAVGPSFDDFPLLSHQDPDTMIPTSVATASDGPRNAAVPSSGGSSQASHPPSASRPVSVDDNTSQPNDKRTKLVSQFATLASRLGIELPGEVLNVLRKEGADTKDLAHIFQHFQSEEQRQEQNAVVQEIEKAATDAIKSVEETRKRGFEEVPTTSAAGTTTDLTSAFKAQPKRRKKPQISECERRLSQLKDENKMLKYHLNNVSSQAHKFEQGRLAAEKEIKNMARKGASEENMNKAVHNYVEMYSDYGRHRQQELFFHLDQLQRLANPTNFTKMGLWTLGQHAKDPKNPISNILTKELGITPQQGRKIAEERQKIQRVCLNLRECLSLLQRLKQLCEQKTQIFHDRLTKCRQILSPLQVIQLLIWIDENSKVLGSVCPGWGSEQIKGPNGQT